MSRILMLALAAVLSMTDPTEPLKADATTMNLMALEGAAFDRAVVEQMLKDHQEAVDRLHAEADLAARPQTR